MMYQDPESDVRNANKPKPISGHKFQESLIEGLIENDVDLTVYNLSLLSVYPFSKKKVVRKGGVLVAGRRVGEHIGYINFPYINYILQYFKLKHRLIDIVGKNNPEDIILMVYNSYYIQSKTVLSVKKRYPRVTTCNVVGDLYGKHGLRNPGKGFRAAWGRFIERRQEECQSRFDKYILLAPLMRDALELSERDYVVVEGFYYPEHAELTETVNHNGRKDELETDDRSMRILFYAGSLNAMYGIEHLLAAFKLIKDDKYSLYIAGRGPSEALIKKYAEKDSRIHFLGFLTPKEVKEYQSKATVLISPRQTKAEFVKYSFPSKTFECLASGKPYIAHKLPSEPEEYKDYIQYPEDESDEALARKITEICSLPKARRDAIGKRGREFILTYKNPSMMCKKVADFFKSFNPAD